MDRRTPPSRIALLTLLAFGMASAPVLAGNDQWTVVGQPYGGYILKIAVDPVTPSTLFMVGYPGVFKSTDSGAHWTLVLAETYDYAVDVEIEPENHTTVYVATQGAGIFKSTDDGTTWAGINTGIPDLGPGNPQEDSLGQVVVDPVNDGVAYALTYNNGIYKTVDGGAHWTAANTGLGTLMAQGMHNMTALAVDPANPNTLYMTAEALASTTSGGAFSSDASTGLYMSTNGGASWTQSLTNLPFDSLIIDPNNDQNVYAGGLALYASTNGGSSWVAVTGSAATVQRIIAIDPTNSNNMWGNTILGVLYASPDGGAHWALVPAGGSDGLGEIAVDPVTPANLYARGLFGLYKSTDGGGTWQESDIGFYGVITNIMFMDNSGIIYLGSEGTGIYKSSDDGATWSEADNGINLAGYQGLGVDDLVEDPNAASTLYAATGIGMYKTTDAGADWTPLNNGIPANSGAMDAVAVDPENSQTVYAGTEAAGVFKSIDGGANWQVSTTGITDPIVMSLAVNPANSQRVFAGTWNDGLFESTDGGDSWSAAAGLQPGLIWAIAIDPKTPSTIYISSNSQGIEKSTDGGATWTSANNGLEPNGYTSIQIDPNNTSIIYVSPIIGIGDVYVSSDAGSSWQPLTNGLPTSARSVTQAVTLTTQVGPTLDSVRGGKFERARRLAAARPQSVSTGITVNIGAVAADPRTSKVYGADKRGQVYVYDDINPPSSSSSGGSGNSGAGGSSSSGGGGGGGGAVSLLSLLLLLMSLGFARRRRG